MLRFLDFPCSLKYCIAIFTFQEDIFTDWLWERSTFSSPFWGFWGFLRSVLWIHVSTLFVPLEKEFLRLSALSWSCRARLGAHSLPLALPWVVWMLKCAFSQPCKVEPTFSTCSWAFCKGLHSLSSGRTHGVSSGMGFVWGRHMDPCGCPWASWGVIFRQGVPSGLCVASWWSLQRDYSRICFPLMPFKSPDCCSPCLLPHFTSQYFSIG